MTLRGILFFVIAPFLAAAADARKPHLVASFLPLHAFASNIAGADATTELLIPGGSSPHDYQFTPGDMRRLQSADLLLVNGLGLEPWMQRMLRNSPKLRTFVAANGLEDQLIAGEHTCHNHHGQESRDHNHFNPHIWMDPILAARIVTNMAGALSLVQPALTATFHSNAAIYVRTLLDLDRDIAETLRPFAGAAVLTYHDALPYFARRYGLQVAAVVEPSPEVAPSGRRLADLRAIVKQRKVRALLVDAGAPSQLAKRIAREFGLPLVQVDLMETGQPSASVYQEAMRKNANAIKEALRPHAPN